MSPSFSDSSVAKEELIMAQDCLRLLNRKPFFKKLLLVRSQTQEQSNSFRASLRRNLGAGN